MFDKSQQCWIWSTAIMTVLFVASEWLGYAKIWILRRWRRKYFNCHVEIKCQLDVTGLFIADLIACSTCFGHQYAHHQELKSIIQRLLPVVFRAVFFKLLVWCGAEGYVSGLQDAAASCKYSILTASGKVHLCDFIIAWPSRHLVQFATTHLVPKF